MLFHRVAALVSLWRGIGRGNRTTAGSGHQGDQQQRKDCFFHDLCL